MSGGGKTTRQRAIIDAMPTDERGWWTSEEIDAFLDEWQRLDLPAIIMIDGQEETVLFCCADSRYAAALIDMAESVDNTGRWNIRRGEYVASIVQAEVKETNSGDTQGN